MDFLKKVWPFAFQVKKQDSASFKKWLTIGIVAIVVCVVISSIITATGLSVSAPALYYILLPLLSLCDLYFTAHIVFTILRYTGVFKDEEEKQ